MSPSIGEVIRQLREARGLSQYDVERLSGGRIKRGWLATVETSPPKHPPRAEVMGVLAEVLGTTPAEMYERAGIIELPSDLPPSEKQLLADFRVLPHSLQEFVLNMIRDLVRKKSDKE